MAHTPTRAASNDSAPHAGRTPRGDSTDTTQRRGRLSPLVRGLYGVRPIVKRCEHLGCEIVFPERAATGGRLRRFCSDYCRAAEHRRNRPRPTLLPPLPPPASWYPRSATPPAWPPTPTLTRSEAVERWAEIVAAANSQHRAARTIHEKDPHADGDAIKYKDRHEAPRRSPSEVSECDSTTPPKTQNQRQPIKPPKNRAGRNYE